MTRSSVLLPLPDGPRRASTSPPATVRSTPVEDRRPVERDGDVAHLERHGRHGVMIVGRR